MILKHAQVQLQRSPSNLEYQQTESEVYYRFMQSSYLAEMFIQQRSKATHIKLGDDNTRYFYSVIKHRKLKQTTIQLRDSSGNWQTDVDTIAGTFVNYYEELLGRKPNGRIHAVKWILDNGPLISVNQQLEIMKSFT